MTKKHLYKLSALLLVLSLTGCGSEAVVNDEQPSVNEDITSAVSLAPAKETVVDFYDEVNREWLAANPLKDFESDRSKYSESNDIIDERMLEILSSGKLSASEDPTLNKFDLYYNQLIDEELRETASMQAIRALTDRVQAAKSLEELVELMSDEEYSFFNPFFSVNYFYHTADCPVLVMYFNTLGNIYFDVGRERRDYMITGYQEMLMDLGYSEEDALRISKNGNFMDGKVQQSAEPNYGSGTGYTYDFVKDAAFRIDYCDLLEKFGYLNQIPEDPEALSIYTYNLYMTWINNNFTPENFEYIRDYMTLSILDETYTLGSLDYYRHYKIMDSKMYGALDAPDISIQKLALFTLYNSNHDALENLYVDKYVSDLEFEKTSKMFEEIRASYLELIHDIAWLIPEERDRLIEKINDIELYMCRRDFINDLSDFEVKDNPYESYISICKSDRNFWQDHSHDTDGTIIFDADMFTTNAQYFASRNCVFLQAGIYSVSDYENAASYEEELASLGFFLAHEIGHSMDPHNFPYDKDLIYVENWIENAEPYNRMYNALKLYYAVITTDNNNRINYEKSCGEIWADYFSVETLLRVMSRIDNPDYDKFFKAFAKFEAANIRPQTEELQLAHDPHPTDKERVNCTLYQFDKFYEIYDVSPSSKYYVDMETARKLY